MSATLISTDGSPARRGPCTGQTIAGKYLLGDLVGRGGRGEVYSALQLDLDREVAVKLLAEAADGEEDRGRFLREMRIAADIRHPCVVQIYDAGVGEDGRPYCVMELLQGETLEERLERVGTLGATEAVAIVASLCLALQAVHDRGFLHRDVKPGNVFLARRQDGGADPKLIDFGIAKRVALSDETRHRITDRGLGRPAATALNIIVGTPRYLSPEQILGARLDPRSDVYALAVTLYEMLAGAPPFMADDIGDLLAHIVAEAPEPLALRAPERHVPEPLDRVVLGALAKDPAARPGAADFATALWTALAESRSGDAPRPGGTPVPSRELALAVVAGAAALAAAILFIVLQGGPDGAVPQPTVLFTVATVGAAAPAARAPERTAALPDPAPAATPSSSPSEHAPRVAAPAARPRSATYDLKTPY